MRHARAARHLSEYLDGTLLGRSAKRLEAHLAVCAGCRNELVALRRTTELLRSLRSGEEAPDVSAAVLARIRAGEAAPSVLDRLRASAGRFGSALWGAPLATAAVGLVVLAIVPRIEVEVSIPAVGSRPAAEAPAARAPSPPRAPTPALATRRVHEPFLPNVPAPARVPSVSVDCWEQPSFEACQEHRRFLELALRDTPAFLERVDAVPSTQRERWIGELSRFAAEAGSASSVAERLRESSDPRAWQMAPRFEAATFGGR